MKNEFNNQTEHEESYCIPQEAGCSQEFSKGCYIIDHSEGE